jgi:Mg2+ and Co2+ transporter CorA
MKPRDRRFLELSHALDRLIADSSGLPFQQVEPALKALETRLLRQAASHTESTELRRRIAEALFTEAYARDCAWPVLGRTLRRIQRLGYSNVERRYHVAALYALWCQRHPEHPDQEARRLLEDAQRSLMRLPRRHAHRRELLERLSGLRSRTGFHTAPSERKRRST